MLEWLEGFWMEYGEWAMFITGGATLIGAVYTLYRNGTLSKKAVNQTIEAEVKLSSEHVKLSAEHTEIRAGQQVILDRATDNKCTLTEIRQSITCAAQRQVEEASERKLQYASLDDAQKKLVSSVSEIGKFSEEFGRLVKENLDLNHEIEQLTKTNQHLNQEVTELKAQVDVLLNVLEQQDTPNQDNQRGR